MRHLAFRVFASSQQFYSLGTRVRIDFYTRPGCTLCEDARRTLRRVCGDRPWSEINVEEDPALLDAYGEYVPVVEVNGRRVGQWRIDEAALREAIMGKDKRVLRHLFRRGKAH